MNKIKSSLTQSNLLIVLTLFISMTFSVTLPGKVKGFASTLIKGNQKIGTVITVLERNSRLCHIFLGGFFYRQIAMINMRCCLFLDRDSLST